MTEDMALVREYATSQSERAFEQLVARHLNMVYFRRVAPRGRTTPLLVEDERRSDNAKAGAQRANGHRPFAGIGRSRRRS